MITIKYINAVPKNISKCQAVTNIISKNPSSTLFQLAILNLLVLNITSP